MATQVFTDGKVLWNSVDLSDHGTSVQMNYAADEVESTAFGATTHTSAGGLKHWDMTLDFNNDEASSSVMQTFFPDVGVTRTVEIRPTSAIRGATNPGYTGTGLCVSINPIQGRVGELSKTQVRIVCAGALSRATS